MIEKTYLRGILLFDNMDIVGLIPAAGRATRLSPLPCSKELYPIGFRRVDEDGSLRPKTVCHYLLEKMHMAGIAKAFMVLRDGKWDIPSYFGDGTMLDMQIAYLIMRLPFGVPFTLDQAYPFVHDKIIALGFPDIMFKPDDAFGKLLNRQADTNAEVVLGLFPTDQPQKWDMVDLDGKGRISKIVIKPSKTKLRYAWVIAVWTEIFTHFMHNYLSAIQETRKHGNDGNNVSIQRELFVGEVIQAAIDHDLKIEGVLFPEGTCLDIGTSDDLVKAVCDLC